MLVGSVGSGVVSVRDLHVHLSYGRGSSKFRLTVHNTDVFGTSPVSEWYGWKRRPDGRKPRRRSGFVFRNSDCCPPGSFPDVLCCWSREEKGGYLAFVLADLTRDRNDSAPDGDAVRVGEGGSGMVWAHEPLLSVSVHRLVLGAAAIFQRHASVFLYV